MARGSDNLTEQMNAVTKEHFNDGQIIKQVYDKTQLLNLLKERDQVKIKGGIDIRKTLRLKEYGQATSIDPTDARTTPIVATRNYITVDWRYLVCSGGALWNEVAMNAGEHQIIDLVADKREEMTDDMNKEISTQFYQTARAGTDMNGFFTFVITAGTTYGSIAPGTYAEWEAGLYDTTTTTLALYGTGSLDAGLRATAFQDSPEHALIVTTRAGLSLYNAKLLPGERRQPEGNKAGANFWTDSYFERIPIMSDPQCGAGDFMFLDLKHLEFIVHPDYNFTFDGWEDDPDRYHATRGFISVMGNFLCDRRKTFGAYTAITS